MQISIKVPVRWTLDSGMFDNPAAIERRAARVALDGRAAARTILRYLYLSDGPANLPRNTLLAGVKHLKLAEQKVVRWLYTRTNGKLRHAYGHGVLAAVRRARGRCEDCGLPDVRVLNLDHVHGRKTKNTSFRCLCANCHAIKSLKHDWYA